MFKAITSLIATVGLVSASPLSDPKKMQYGANTLQHPRIDPSTYGNTEHIHTTHFHLDWNVDFDTEMITGSITHDMKVLQDTNKVYFDIWDIDIDHVNLLDAPNAAMGMKEPGQYVELTQEENEGTLLTFETQVLTEVTADQGDVLIVHLPFTKPAGSKLSLRIWYSTSPSGNGFSWMTPDQTAGKVYPYMYTQCEDINCRSIMPIQDTPSNRATYSARIVVPDTLVARLSANTTTAPEPIEGTSTTVAYFSCTIPIPNYLFAIAVGDIVERKIGDRTSVVTEPS